MQALQNQPITLYGDGSQTRSFCYVDDLVEALIGVMATPAHICGPINIGNPVEFTIRELAELVIRLTGSKSRIEFRPLPADDPRQRRPDITQAKALLEGWAPVTALEEGLLRTIDYFRRLLDMAPRRSILSRSLDMAASTLRDSLTTPARTVSAVGPDPV